MASALTNRDVLFVGGLPRTGGSMLPFMFDGVPGFYTPPFEMHIAGATGGTVDEQVFVDNEPHIVVAITSRMRVLKKGRPPKPIACKTKDQFSFDTQDFYDEYLAAVERGEVDARNYMAQKIVAFFRAIDRPIPDHRARLIAHSGKAMAYDSGHFLEAADPGLYVYTRRGDAAWWRSYAGKFRNLEVLRDHKVVEQFLELKHECDDLAVEYARRYGDRYRILDYEALVDDPVGSVATVCRWLGTELPAGHDPGPTFLGIPVPANSSFRELKTETAIIPSATPRADTLDEDTAALVEHLALEAAPAGDVAPISDREFRRRAARVHRHFYVLETFRKHLSKTDRIARRAAQEQKAGAPAVS